MATNFSSFHNTMPPFNMSRTTRISNRIFSAGLGFVNRENIALQLRNFANRDYDATTSTATQLGILKNGRKEINLKEVTPSDISNIVNQQRWNSLLETLGETPFDTRHITVAERVTFLIGDKVLDTKLSITRGVDHIIEKLAPLSKIKSNLHEGIQASLDFELTAGVCGQSGLATTNLIAAIALGTVTAFALISLFHVTIPMGLVLGLSGAFVLTHSFKMRNLFLKITKGFLPIGVAAASMYFARTYLGLVSSLGYTLLAGVAGFLATYLLIGIYDGLKQTIRQYKILRELQHKTFMQTYTFEILESLYSVREAAPSKLEKSKQQAIIKLNETSNFTNESKVLGREEKLIVLQLIAKAKVSLQNADQIEKAIKETCHVLDNIKIPDLHKPNQKLIALSRISRILNAVFFLTIQPCFFTHSHGPFEAAAFASFYAAAGFFTYGSFAYMGTVEQTERVEPLHFPQFSKDKTNRPSMMLYRYTSPGGSDSENAMDFFAQDILTHLEYGFYRVLIRNAAAWTCKGQIFGLTKKAHVFEGRIQQIKKQIDTLFGSSLEEDAKIHLAFRLSIEKRTWPAHRVMDDVGMAAYDNAPSEGQVVRFRDSLGHWHGEQATYYTLHRLFKEKIENLQSTLNISPEQAKTLQKKYKKVLKGLQEAVLDQRDITLDNLHNRDALIQALERMNEKVGEKNKLTQPEIEILVDKIVIPNRTQYLRIALRRFALIAGIDTKRAFQIAENAARMLESERRADPIAQLGKELLFLGNQMDTNHRKELEQLLIEEYSISQEQAKKLLNQIINAKIQEQAKGMARLYNVDTAENLKLLFEARAQYEFARALEAGEDGNITKALFWILNQSDESNLSPGQKQLREQFREFCNWAKTTKKGAPPVEAIQKALKKFSAKIVTKKDPSTFTELEWVQFIDYFIREEKGKSLALNLAKIIEYEAYVRQMESFGSSDTTRAEFARDLAEDITNAIAHLKLFGVDWENHIKTEMSTNKCSFEGAQFLVWQRQKESIKEEVNLVAAEKSLTPAEKQIVWELIETELDRNQREIEIGSMGIYQIIARETDGVRQINNLLVQAYENTTSLPRKCLDQVAKLKGERKKLIAQLAELVIIPNQENIQANIEPLNKIKQDKAAAINKEITELVGKGIGNKRKPGTRGWFKSFREIEETVPQILLGRTALGVEEAGEFYEMAGTRTEAYKKNLNESHLSVLRQLTKNETAQYNEKLTLRDWLQGHETDSSIPGERNRLVERDTLPGYADAVVDLAGSTSSELNEKLAGIAPGVVTKSLSALNWMCNNKERMGSLISETQKATANGQIKRRENSTGQELEVTHHFSQKVAHLDITAAKASLTNVGLLGATIGDQIGVFMRNCIKKLFEEQGGQTRVHNQIHNWLRIDVTELLCLDPSQPALTAKKQSIPIVDADGQLIVDTNGRLRHDITPETADMYSKIYREITPDDIARKLIKYISEGQNHLKAAERVWKEMNLSEKEIKATENYCEGKISDIKKNFFDIAQEVAILTHGRILKGVVAAYHELKSGRIDQDYINNNKQHPAYGIYLNELNTYWGNNVSFKKGLGAFLAARKLNLHQKRELSLMAKDLKRKLKNDESKPQEEKLHQGPWHTIPALWTPRDSRNERTEFLGLRTMRREMLFDRPRTLEEIVAWQITQQEMPEHGIEEGRKLEFAIAARKIAQIADAMTPSQLTKISVIRDFTPNHKRELKEKRELFISKLRITLQEHENNTPAEIINYLDEARYERTFFEGPANGTEAELHGNWDWDNIASTRFPIMASHFRSFNGILVHRGELMIQNSGNYEYQGQGTLIESQYAKDNTLRDGMWRARGAKSPRGMVRHRYKTLQKTAFPIGYDGLMHIDGTHECVSTIKAVNFENRDNGTWGELFWGKKIAGSNIYKDINAVTGTFFPAAGIAFMAGMFLFTGGVAGFSSLLVALGVGAISYGIAKAAKLPKMATFFATYLGMSVFAKQCGLDPSLFSGHTMWQLFGYSSLANLLFFNLIPKWGSKLLGKKLQLNQFIVTRILYNILRIVEDSATGLAIMIKYFLFNGTKGAWQWNGAVTSFRTLIGQWFRWFGGNSEFLPEYKSIFLKNRQALSSGQWSDLLACYLYPLSALAININRLGIVGVTTMWIVSLLLANPEISTNPIMPHLGWVSLLGLAAWKTSMWAFKSSRHHEGAITSSAKSIFDALITGNWEKLKLAGAETIQAGKALLKGDWQKVSHSLGMVTEHLVIENYAQPAYQRGVIDLLILDDRSPFVVTKNQIRPQNWGSRFEKIIRENWYWTIALTYIGYKVITNNLITDTFQKKDYMSAPMAIVGFWITYEWAKLFLGHIILRFGNVSNEWDRAWEDKDKNKNRIENPFEITKEKD